ncbi:MAG: serine/threonine protein kinase [Deltaproteobacteria bacterium]|nr:serine/threonine protein kinase [Deltaproteobacteria bacterium]
MSHPSSTPEATLAPDTRFGRYRVVRCIGVGGMGAVYEAVHDDLEKRVALKTLHPSMAREPEARARFLREGRAASRIRHPNVVEVFDVGQHDDTLFLVMEHLAGEDLAALIAREGPLSVERLVDLILPVIAAVATAHEEGVVHRDLKPENIFLAQTRNGAVQPKVLDFGISKVTGAPNAQRITGASSMIGTPLYMSPEQAQGAAVDGRSDQYAIGVILFECATGHVPFNAPELYPLLHAIVLGQHASPRSLRPELPADFEAVIERAMARDADRRYESLHTLGRALLPFASRTNRGLWRDVFGAAPTPLQQPAFVAPPTPVEARPASTLLPRVREVCEVTSTLRKTSRVPAITLGVLAAGLVAAAALLPSRTPAPGTSDSPTVAAPAVALAAPAPAPVAALVAPAPAPAPVVVAPVVVAPAPVLAVRPRAVTTVRSRVAVRADAGAQAPFRLCGGVPCP